MNCASNETLLAMMEKYLDEGRGSTLEQLMLKPLISSIRHKVILEEEVKQLRKERDEARRLACEYYTMEGSSSSGSEAYCKHYSTIEAKTRGWDCFKEPTQ